MYRAGTFEDKKMIIQEREPVVYTTSSTDWSAASVILAVSIIALFGFLIYYFAIMHAARMENLPPVPSTTVIQQPVPNTVVQPMPIPNTVVQPMPVPTPVPQPILIPTPSQVPQATTPTSQPGTPSSTEAPADTSSSNQSATDSQ